MFVRIPGWSKRNTVRVNGTSIEGATAGQYLPIKRRWASGDVVELEFDMEPQAVQANLAVNEDRGRVAFQRGPILYCMEQLDQPLAAADPESFPRYTALLGQATTAHFQPGLLEGIVVLEHPGAWLPAEPSVLYQASGPAGEEVHPTTLRLIPYYAWSNRELSAMQVWVPYRQA